MGMGARENLQRLADRKAQEITDLERQIDMAKAYLQAIQDSIRALPKESVAQTNGEEATSELRSGTLLARTRDALLKQGKPMHITEILSVLGVSNTKSARVSLVGSLGAYVRKQQIFSRPGPNRFGLIGMKTQTVEQQDLPSLPDEFGSVTESE
jgi:hypothetical protein